MSDTFPLKANWLVLPAGALVIGLPFVAFTGLYLSHFYSTGGFLLDSGWQAYMISHGGLALRSPTALGFKGNFFFHVSPILIGIALFRHALPVSDLQFAAGFFGFCHALPGAAVFWILRSGYRLNGTATTAAAALIAIAFAFNGTALAIARYPHYEILAAASIISFLVAFVRRQWGLALVFFLVALLTREDAGFHLFGILFIIIALNRWYGVDWALQKTEIRFAIIAFAYSASVIVLQRLLATGPSTMTVTYLGTPPFAHLTAATLLSRIAFWVVYRPYVILPAIVAGLWTARTRNPYIIAGYLAFLPWTLLQLMAHSEIASSLSAYYAYPYMIAAFFPLVGILIGARRRGRAERTATPVLAFAVMVATSFVGVSQQYNPGGMNLLRGLLSPPSMQLQARTDSVIARLVQAKPSLGVVIADTSIAALAPDDFVPEETLWHGDHWLSTQVSAPDTVIYFAGGFESAKAREVAAAAGLADHYLVPGTAIRIATNRSLSALAPIGNSDITGDIVRSPENGRRAPTGDAMPVP